MEQQDQNLSGAYGDADNGTVVDVSTGEPLGADITVAEIVDLGDDE
jgi:hypothetical protein